MAIVYTESEEKEMADKDSKIVIQDTEELFPGGYARYNINVQQVFQDIDKRLGIAFTHSLVLHQRSVRRKQSSVSPP